MSRAAAARVVSELLCELGAVVDDELLEDVAVSVRSAVHRAARGGRPVDVSGAWRVEDLLREAVRERRHGGLRSLVGPARGRLVTIEELDGVVPGPTVRRWCAAGWVTARKVGGAWVVLLEDVERLMRERDGR